MTRFFLAIAVLLALTSPSAAGFLVAPILTAFTAGTAISAYGPASTPYPPRLLDEARK